MTVHMVNNGVAICQHEKRDLVLNFKSSPLEINLMMPKPRGPRKGPEIKIWPYGFKETKWQWTKRKGKRQNLVRPKS